MTNAEMKAKIADIKAKIVDIKVEIADLNVINAEMKAKIKEGLMADTKRSESKWLYKP